MIEARGLTKRYGQKLAVDQLSFAVLPGKVTGFLGPNGAGKTTTMRMILGLDTPTAGTVTVNGRPYRQLVQPMRQVGALLDAKAVHSGRNAYNHLLCLAQSNGLPRARVDQVLDLMGMTEVRRKRTKGFSLGMGQRLGIAAALLGDPPVLMFDEPVNGLDPEGIRWIRTLMRRLAAEGRTVFVSSHLMSEMEDTADHLLVIGRGRLIADMPIREFIARSSQNHVRVRSPQAQKLMQALAAEGAQVTNGSEGALLVTGMPVERVGELAARDGVVLHELAVQKASLEEAYLEVTNHAVEFRAGAPGGGGPATGYPGFIAPGQAPPPPPPPPGWGAPGQGGQRQGGAPQQGWQGHGPVQGVQR